MPLLYSNEVNVSKFKPGNDDIVKEGNKEY